ncbi:hypothetical protein GF373_14750 [bacterium]|nr:hypothetical protein [bacterium]
MMDPNTNIPKDIQNQIYRIADQYQSEQILRSWMRFGLHTLGLLILFLIGIKLCAWYGFSILWPTLIWVGAEIGVFYYYIIYRLQKPVREEQIALFIEERHPELENRLITAVSVDNKSDCSSKWMLEQFYRETQSVVKNLTFSDMLDGDLLAKLSVSALGYLAVSVLLVLLFYNLWVTELPKMFQPVATTFTEVPHFTVEPGNTRVRQGDDLTVICKTDLIEEKILLEWRYPNQDWNIETMGRSVSDTVYHFTFTNIQSLMEYRVSTGNRRSPRYTITPWLPPRVESIDVAYTYPDYLDFEPKTTPNSGAISAVEGTTVEITVWANKPMQNANMVLSGTGTIPLKADTDHSWKSQFVLQKSDTYSIALTDEEGNTNEHAKEYKINVETDQPPEITIQHPRRDDAVSLLDEIPFAFELEDDYGIKDYGLQYTIAGREPVKIPLHEKGTNSTKAEAKHLLMLETLDLEPGDLITWCIWAADEKPDRNEYEILSDPFFLEIRPFKEYYREAMSNAGQQQQQQSGEEEAGAASQKEIVIAIWNLRRDTANMDNEKYENDKRLILEEQIKIKQKTMEDGGDNFSLQQLAIDAMNETIVALDKAKFAEPIPRLSQAMESAQQAYQFLLKMKPEQTQVQRGRQMAGGGGGSQNQPRIDELELDRQRNFYEEERQTRQDLEKTDKAMNKIKELAQRQDEINEEISKLISAMEKEKEAEELKRKLERLQEEEQRNLERLDEAQRELAQNDMRDPTMRETSQQLNRTRDLMNRSLENMRNNEWQQARSSGQRALSELNEIQDKLKNYSREAAAQRMAQLQEKFDRLLEQEQAIQDKLKEAREEENAPSLTLNDETDQVKQGILQEKDALAEDFLETIGMASDLAERSAQSQNLMSHKLNDWLRDVSQEGIEEDIRNERQAPFIQYGAWDQAMQREEAIEEKLEKASNKLQHVAEALIESDLEGMQKALEKLQELQNINTNSPIAAAEAQVDAASPAQPGPPSPADKNGNAQTGTRQQGEQQSQAGEPSNTQTESTQTGQSQSGAERQGGLSQPGGGGGPRERLPFLPRDLRSQEAMNRIVSENGREWVDTLRDAEQLLPQGNPNRDELTRVREQTEQMRADLKRFSEPPKYDMYLRTVAHPLVRAAEALEKDIQRILSEKEFALQREDEVPLEYQDPVADYFKAIAEQEEQP